MEKPLQFKLNTIYNDREVTIELHRTKNKETMRIYDAKTKHLLLLAPEDRSALRDLMNKSINDLDLHRQNNK